MPDASREAKDKQRREKARKQLLKLNKIKREEKIATLLTQRNRHIALQAQQESCDAEEYQLLLEEAGHESEEVCVCVCVCVCACVCVCVPSHHHPHTHHVPLIVSSPHLVILSPQLISSSHLITSSHLISLPHLTYHHLIITSSHFSSPHFISSSCHHLILIILLCMQCLLRAIQQVESQLEVEQEKLAALVRNLAMGPAQPKEPEAAVSEEWLQSLKERRKVQGGRREWRGC